MCLCDVEPYLSELSSPPSAPTFHTSFYPNLDCTTNPETNPEGNWYTIDCPNADNNGTGTMENTGSLAYNTRNGCDDYIEVIQPNDVSSLIDTCDVPSPDVHKCLGANPGNLASNNLAEAWEFLRNQEIALPVFRHGSIVENGGGNNWVFPVAGVVGIKVCGYQWQNSGNSWTSNDPECLGARQPSGSEIPNTTRRHEIGSSGASCTSS